jgi:hypothetical protein
MFWIDTEATDNRLNATAGTLQETTTSPLHRNKSLARKYGQIQKQMKKTRTQEILFPGSRRNCLFSRELVLCLHHFPHDFVSLSQLAFRSGNMCNIEVMSSDATARF